MNTWLFKWWIARPPTIRGQAGSILKHLVIWWFQTHHHPGNYNIWVPPKKWWFLKQNRTFSFWGQSPFSASSCTSFGGEFSASTVFRYRLPPLPKSTKRLLPPHNVFKDSENRPHVHVFSMEKPRKKGATSEMAMVGGSKKKTRGWTTLEIARLNIQLQGTQNIPPRRALWYLGQRGDMLGPFQEPRREAENHPKRMVNKGRPLFWFGGKKTQFFATTHFLNLGLHQKKWKKHNLDWSFFQTFKAEQSFLLPGLVDEIKTPLTVKQCRLFRWKFIHSHQ